MSAVVRDGEEDQICGICDLVCRVAGLIIGPAPSKLIRRMVLDRSCNMVFCRLGCDQRSTRAGRVAAYIGVFGAREEECMVM